MSIEIAAVLLAGELGHVATVDDVMCVAGRLMDKSCTYDICGEPLFRGEDGKFYTVRIEAELVEISAADAKEMLWRARSREHQRCRSHGHVPTV